MPLPENNTTPIRDDESVDDCLRGKLRIIQKLKGFRFGVDALILADWAISSKPAGKSCLDLGTGTGVIPFILALRANFDRLIGVDLHPELVDMCTRSAKLNGLDDRVQFVQADVRDLKSLPYPDKHDLVISNPPYIKQGQGKVNTNPMKASAKHEVLGTLEDFVSASAIAVSGHGKICFICSAGRTDELVVLLNSKGLNLSRMRNVHSFHKSKAQFVLMEAVKNVPARGSEILNPSYIFEEEGVYSSEMSRIFGEDQSP